MRTKNRRGGKSKASQRSAASSPSSIASPSVTDRDVHNAEDNTLYEASRKETGDVLDKEDSFQKDTCIRCDESGDLLVCTEIGCPIALHEFCMSCEPSFDEERRFYCPYCSYKRALVRVNELRRKAMVAKKALSGFIDTRMVGGGNSLQVGEAEAGKKKASEFSTCGIDGHLANHESHSGNERLQGQDMEVELNQSNGVEDHARTTGDVQATSVAGADGENHENHLGNDSLRDQDMQVEQNQSNEGEDHAITIGDVQAMSVVGVNGKNHENHLGKESLRNQDTQVEQNQSNEEEDPARTAGDVQPMPIVEANGKNHEGPTGSNVSNDIHSTPEVQPCENAMNEEETREADASGTHRYKSLEDKKDGKTMEEETLWLTDDIQDVELVKDQGQLETPSAHHVGEEIAVDDVDHGAEREPQDKGYGGEQIQPDNEGMLENFNLASGNNDVKRKRFKTKANRRRDVQNSNSSRKSLRLRTPDPGKRSPHIQTPDPTKKSPHIQIPKRGKDHATKIEKVSASRNLMLQRASPNQFKNLDFHGGKRKRKLWSTEEEEKLKEGVEKFLSTANKNLPWRKILEFGRHIFDQTRTPVDLKDKWRNIQAK